MANTPSETRNKESARPMLAFVPAGAPRAIAEVLLSAVPGGLLQFIFIMSAAGLNIWSTQSNPAESTYALVYLPVVCLLPLVVGAISTLVHERVQGAHMANIRGSMLTAALAAFVGTLAGSLVIIITGVATKFRPLGGAMSDTMFVVGVPIVMVAVSTVLATIGAALVVSVLNKMEK